jgi:hypothetical protein
LRRQFDLPSGDDAYLDATGLNWETVADGPSRWLLIHERPTHDGYEPNVALTALQIVPGYPESALDMVWFHPALVPKSGRAIRNLSHQQIDGKSFQRWSRHRTPGNPWRPGLDDVAAHLLVVDEWLAREVP